MPSAERIFSPMDSAHAGHQTLRDLLQKQVADFMAKCVIERLEIVQIKEQQCALLAGARAGSQ
jgi:hypothetical protein